MGYFLFNSYCLLHDVGWTLNTEIPRLRLGLGLNALPSKKEKKQSDLRSVTLLGHNLPDSAMCATLFGQQ